MQKAGHRRLKLLLSQGILQGSDFQNQKPDSHQIGQRLGKTVKVIRWRCAAGEDAILE